MKKEKHKIKTTRHSISLFWSFHNPQVIQEYCIKGFDDLPLTQYCWRCGYETKRTQRCHIIPNSLGGADEPSNYVLLCADCHWEAPNVKDKDFMFYWIRATRPDLFEIEPVQGHVFELIFNRKPFSIFENSSDEKFKKKLNEFIRVTLGEPTKKKDWPQWIRRLHNKTSKIFDQTSYHFGTTKRNNHSTRAWTSYQYEKIICEHLKPKSLPEGKAILDEIDVKIPKPIAKKI